MLHRPVRAAGARGVRELTPGPTRTPMHSHTRSPHSQPSFQHIHSHTFIHRPIQASLHTCVHVGLPACPHIPAWGPHAFACPLFLTVAVSLPRWGKLTRRSCRRASPRHPTPAPSLPASRLSPSTATLTGTVVRCGERGGAGGRDLIASCARGPWQLGFGC